MYYVLGGMGLKLQQIWMTGFGFPYDILRKLGSINASGVGITTVISS